MMSCRPAVITATKTYVVRRLDSVEQEVTVLKKATGSEILDRVSRREGGTVLVVVKEKCLPAG